MHINRIHLILSYILLNTDVFAMSDTTTLAEAVGNSMKVEVKVKLQPSTGDEGS
jgi:hypothetical protein